MLNKQQKKVIRLFVKKGLDKRAKYLLQNKEILDKALADEKVMDALKDFFSNTYGTGGSGVPLKGLIHSGYVGYGRTVEARKESFDSWRVYYIFEGSNVAEVEQEVSKELELEGTHINSMYDCTGSFIAGRARVFNRGNRVFVVQSQGRDV